MQQRQQELQIQPQATIQSNQIISAPFLAAPVAISPIVKKSLQIKKNLNRDLNTVTLLKETVVNTHRDNYQNYQVNNNSSDINSIELTKTTIPTKNTNIKTTPTTTIVVQKNCAITPPLTLTSMAGIQLTDSDTSYPYVDMSGAMPTATVEEINVPVFIDEYLQQSEPTSTTSAININSNNNNCKNNSNSSNGNGICIENYNDDNGLFECLNFDFEMIASNNNNNNINNNNNNNGQAEQTMFCQNNDGTYDMSPLNDNNNDIEALFGIKTECKQEEADENLIFDPDFNILGNLNDDEEDSLNLSYFTTEAVDINTSSNEPQLHEYLTNSQQNPMLSTSSSVINSQILIANAEPIVPDCDFGDPNEGIYFADCKLYNSQNTMDMELKYNSSQEQEQQPPKQNNFTKRCRSRSRSPSSTMAAKRSKLHLDITKKTTEVVLNTPEILSMVIDCEDKKNIFCELTNDSNTSSHDDCITEIYTSILHDETIEPPFTPQSCTSSSYTIQTIAHTDYTTAVSSPSSPAISTISATKRKRGHPAKEHSDLPDPGVLAILPESERKHLQDRAKNNEASRLSRRKKTVCENAKKLEEIELSNRNIELLTEKEELLLIEKKLKKYIAKILM